MSDFDRSKMPAQRKKNGLDHPNLKLWGEKQNGSKRFPSLQVTYMNTDTRSDGNPRITVYTNIEGDSPKPIHCKMKTVDLKVILDNLRTVARSKEASKIPMDHLDHIFTNGERSKEPVVTATTIVGRDSDGLCYIAVKAYKRPSLKFVFGPGRYTNLGSGTGDPMPDSTASALYALNWANTIERIYDTLLATEFSGHPVTEKKDWQNKPNQNRGGNNGGGSWGNSKPAYDEDIDF